MKRNEDNSLINFIKLFNLYLNTIVKTYTDTRNLLIIFVKLNAAHQIYVIII